MKRKILFWIFLILGIFLVLDGILSLIFGNACLNSCINNSVLGNIVRVIRAGAGIALIVLAFEYKKLK